MQFNLITVGKCKDKNFQALAEKYLSRIQKLTKFNFIEIPAVKISQKSDPNQVKEREADLIQNKIKPGGFLILLDENGKTISTRALSEKISFFEQQSYSSVTWVIGGSLGLAEKLKQSANAKWQLSEMTLPYELARVLFLEQFYRALSIKENLPYHND